MLYNTEQNEEACSGVLLLCCTVPCSESRVPGEQLAAGLVIRGGLLWRTGVWGRRVRRLRGSRLILWLWGMPGTGWGVWVSAAGTLSEDSTVPCLVYRATLTIWVLGVRFLTTKHCDDHSVITIQSYQAHCPVLSCIHSRSCVFSCFFLSSLPLVFRHCFTMPGTVAAAQCTSGVGR